MIKGYREGENLKVEWTGEKGLRKCLVFDCREGVPKSLQIDKEGNGFDDDLNLFSDQASLEFGVQTSEGIKMSTHGSEALFFEFDKVDDSENGSSILVRTKVKPKLIPYSFSHFRADPTGKPVHKLEEVFIDQPYLECGKLLFHINWLIMENSDSLQCKVRIEWQPPLWVSAKRIYLKINFNPELMNNIALSPNGGKVISTQFEYINYGNFRQGYGYDIPKWISAYSSESGESLNYLYFPCGISRLGKSDIYELRAHKGDKFLRIEFISPGYEVTYFPHNPNDVIRFVLRTGNDRFGGLDEAWNNFIWKWPMGEWIYGEGHLHSTYSDGFDTLKEIAERVRMPILESDYIIVTDHAEERPSLMTHSKQLREWAKRGALAGQKGARIRIEKKKKCDELTNPLFVFLEGKEITLRLNQGGWPPQGPYKYLHQFHVVVYNFPEEIASIPDSCKRLISKFENSTDQEIAKLIEKHRNEFLPPQFSKVINKIHSRGGIAICAHPSAHSPEINVSSEEAKMFDGMEIWFCDFPLPYRAYYDVARKYWDEHLVNGIHLYGFGMTDYHCTTVEEDGPSWLGNYVFVEELTQGTLLNALRLGHHYVGSKLSPTIEQFRIVLSGVNSGAIMGDVLYVVGVPQVEVVTQARCSHQELREMRLIKNGNPIRKQKSNEYQDRLVYKDELTEYTYFRIEIRTIDKLWGAAFSNPIFIYPHMQGPADCWFITHDNVEETEYEAKNRIWTIRVSLRRQFWGGHLKVKCPSKPSKITLNDRVIRRFRWDVSSGMAEVQYGESGIIKLFLS